VSEYLGNVLSEIELALRNGRPGYVIDPPRMEQLLRLFAELTEAKNSVTRENIRLRHLLVERVLQMNPQGATA